jgi:hypothetical protein
MFIAFNLVFDFAQATNHAPPADVKVTIVKIRPTVFQREVNGTDCDKIVNDVAERKRLRELCGKGRGL